MSQFFIQQTNIQNGDVSIQRTFIQKGQDQAGVPNLFDGPRPYHFEGRHRGHYDPQMFNRPQLNNNYDNSCECENQGEEENFDFDNSDIERFLMGGLNNNKCQQNSQQNNLEDRLDRLENLIKNNQQPEKQENSLENRLDRLENLIKGKQSEKQENSIENRIKTMEDSIRPKREANDFEPNTNKDKQDFEAKLKELEAYVAKKKDEKAFEAKMNQLKEDQKEAARRGFIGTPDKPEKKEAPAPIIKHEVKHKPKHKPVHKSVHVETSIYKSGAIQNHMLGLPEGTKYDSLFTKPLDMQKCH